MLCEIVGQRASNHLAFTIFWRLNVWVCVPSKHVYYTQNPNITLKIIFHYTQVLWRVGSSAFSSSVSQNYVTNSLFCFILRFTDVAKKEIVGYFLNYYLLEKIAYDD